MNMVRKMVLFMLTYFGAMVVATYVFAQPAEGGDEISFGKYGITALITLLLTIFYNVVPDKSIGNRARPLIAIGLGVVLALISITYHNESWAFKIIVDRVLSGIISGASVVGLYEGARAIIKPRPGRV